MADSSSTTQPNAGIVFSPTSTGSPRDVITWHHVGASRVWVHAREVKGAYVVISIEVQHVGNLKPPPAADRIEPALTVSRIEGGYQLFSKCIGGRN